MGHVLEYWNHFLFSSCELHMFKFPYDSQECFLEFGNLAEPDTKMNITLDEEVGFHMDFYSNSSEFHVKSAEVSRNTWTVGLIGDSMMFGWFIHFTDIWTFFIDIILIESFIEQMCAPLLLIYSRYKNVSLRELFEVFSCVIFFVYTSLRQTIIESSVMHIPGLRFTLVLERKPLHYLLNIIIPVIVLAMLSAMNFSVPLNSGEKLSLGISILLAFSVFMLILQDNTPQTDTPLLGI